MIDSRGHLVMFNKAMAKLLGDSAPKDTHCHFQQLMPAFWPFFVADFALAKAGGVPPSRELSWHADRRCTEESDQRARGRVD